MAEMTAEMMDLINKHGSTLFGHCFQGRGAKCGSLWLYQGHKPDTITITALHLDKTFRNLEENPKVALVFHSELGKKGERKEVRGWQIKGEATLVKSGEYYKRAKEGAVKRFGEEAAKMVKAAVVIRVKEIYNIVSGPDAGKRVD